MSEGDLNPPEPAGDRVTRHDAVRSLKDATTEECASSIGVMVRKVTEETLLPCQCISRTFVDFETGDKNCECIFCTVNEVVVLALRKLLSPLLNG